MDKGIVTTSEGDGLKRSSRDLELLGQAIRELNAARGLPAILRSLVTEALRLTDAENGAVGTYRDGSVRFEECSFQGAWVPLKLHRPSGHDAAGHVALRREPYLSNNAAHDPHVSAEIRQRLGERNLLACPVIGSSGEVLAIVEVHNTHHQRPFDDRDAALLACLAGGAAMAIENARSATGTATAEALQRYARVFQDTAEGITITAPDLTILDVNPAFCKVTGYTREEAIGKTPRILQSRRHDTSFYRAMWESINDLGYWRGEIWNRRKNGEIYPEFLTINTVHDDDGNLINYIAAFTDISTIRESQERLQHLAHHDALTDLPNKLLFNARIEHALHRARREDHRIAVLFVDLDRFKNVNDTLGHPVGDELLRKMARRLSESVRGDDTVARLGGDEFTIILEGIHESRDAVNVAQKIIERMAEPFDLDGHEIYMTTSIGISVFPDDGTDSTALLRNADVAMYRAKDMGRNNYQFYTQELTDQTFERLSMEKSLRQAMEDGEFELYYQPQYNLVNQRLIGAEALVRWRHRELGLINPERFIPLAEEMRLIDSIGRWILNEACSQTRSWLDQGYVPMRVAVNLSGFQVLDGSVVQTVSDCLSAHSLPGDSLELELAESLLLDVQPQVIATLDALKELGVCLVIDDFGTGCSSLGHLKDLPIDKLKIGQSLIHRVPNDPQYDAIARAVIALGRCLQIPVIAEGVENPAQEAFLRREGCDLAQGYRYGPPVDGKAFVSFLTAPSLKCYP